MSAQLAWSYLRARPLGTLLNVLLLALGVGTIGFVLIVNGQIGDSLNRDAQGIDLVVGAKGSPIQLILAGIFHLDAPTGNIPLKSAEELAKNPLIKRVIPLSLGDSFRGYRIVGTSPDYVGLYGGTLAVGRMWKDKMEAVLGSTVAAKTGLGVGDRFVGSHGLTEGGPVHGDSVYTVVGVLKPTGTVLDRLVLVNTESVWFVHEGKITDPEEQKVIAAERQVTVLLMQYASPLAAVSLPRKINTETDMLAASPAYESARLFRMIGVGADVIKAFGGVVLATAALSLFIALYHALNERAYDIAVLRTLGARPIPDRADDDGGGAHAGGVGWRARLAAGACAGRDSCRVDGAAGERAHQCMGILGEELWLLVPALLAAALAALLPSWRAAHADISATLARRN